jgi:crotonobetainyl-CoA:carnitine CoA-transferase CaiB-like acyl-CoA transferase
MAMGDNTVLQGIRILSLEQVHVLPWGTAFLADFGAEVIRVESATHMNDRRSGPFPDNIPGEEWWNEGGTFAYWARNKKSLCLDVTHPQGKEVFLSWWRIATSSRTTFVRARCSVWDWIMTVWSG